MAASSAAATAALPRGDRGGDADIQGQPSSGAAHEYLLVEFALTLLHRCVTASNVRIHGLTKVQI